VQLRVEVGDREAVAELEAPFRARRLDDEPVVDEVEPDLEPGAVGRVQQPRGQAAHVDVQRHVPPVVLRRQRGHLDLADDLDPEVERVLRRLPLLERQRGQRFHR
jgi:hypothetical protein